MRTASLPTLRRNRREMPPKLTLLWIAMLSVVAGQDGVIPETINPEAIQSFSAPFSPQQQQDELSAALQQYQTAAGQLSPALQEYQPSPALQQEPAADQLSPALQEYQPSPALQQDQLLPAAQQYQPSTAQQYQPSTAQQYQPSTAQQYQPSAAQQYQPSAVAQQYQPAQPPLATRQYQPAPAFQQPTAPEGMPDGYSTTPGTPEPLPEEFIDDGHPQSPQSPQLQQYTQPMSSQAKGPQNANQGPGTSVASQAAETAVQAANHAKEKEQKVASGAPGGDAYISRLRKQVSILGTVVKQAILRTQTEELGKTVSHLTAVRQAQLQIRHAQRLKLQAAEAGIIAQAKYKEAQAHLKLAQDEAKAAQTEALAAHAPYLQNVAQGGPNSPIDFS